MKFKRTVLFTIILTMFLSICAYADDIFNFKNVYELTKELSSNKYKGRLAGDKGNYMAQQLIEGYFKSLGLKPAGDNGTYLQNFNIYVPSLEGACYFKVFDTSGKFIKEYKYGTEFKEAYFGSSSPGTVIGTIRTSVDNKGDIYLSQDQRTGESSVVYENDESLLNNGIKAVIYPFNNGTMRFRSPYKQQIPYNRGLVKIYAAQNILPEIEEYSKNNYNFEIKSTVNFKKVTVSNILGIIEGTDKTLSPVILSAHFDHVGFDADGIIYPGALDNASGTAMLIEAARVLKNYSTGKRTIIFAAFNGEEEGLLGSRYFVQHPTVPIKNAECINFDMVGTIKNIPLSVLSSNTRASFASEILGIAKNASVNTNILYVDNSDHASFCMAGYNAVTLIHDDTDKIHTPADSIVNFNQNKLDDVSVTLESFLYSKGILIEKTTYAENYTIREKLLVPGAAVLAGLIIILAIYELKKKRKEY